jgi:hypothetical protein
MISELRIEKMKAGSFSKLAATLVAVTAILVMLSFRAAAETNSSGSAQLLVTVESSKKATSTELKQGDVMVREDHDRVQVTALTPLRGQPLELYVAIDQAVGPAFDTKIADLTKFINSLPANVAVGVVALQDGGITIRQKPTTDHGAAAKKIGLPMPGHGVSPFESISELIKQWPASNDRREIVLLSPGIEPFGPQQLDNPYIGQAITAVQRAEIPVFAIYTPARGHWGHTFWRETWGETYLSQLADESGGEGYNMTALNPASYSSYLDDIATKLQNQYRVAFTPKPQPKPGFLTVRATTEVPNLSLLSQDRVWIQ